MSDTATEAPTEPVLPAPGAVAEVEAAAPDATPPAPMNRSFAPTAPEADARDIEIEFSDRARSTRCIGLGDRQ